MMRKQCFAPRLPIWQPFASEEFPSERIKCPAAPHKKCGGDKVKEESWSLDHGKLEIALDYATTQES
jgi:hypothetical protein